MAWPPFYTKVIMCKPLHQAASAVFQVQVRLSLANRYFKLWLNLEGP